MTRPLGALAALALIAAACTSPSGTGTTASLSLPAGTAAAPTSASSPIAGTLPTETTTTFSVRPELGDPQVVYYFMGEPGGAGAEPHLIPVWRDGSSPQGVAGAIETLLAGPTGGEQASLHGEIPDTTRLLGVELIDRTAVIDLSAEFESGSPELRRRIAQLVYTATRFPEIDGIAITIDGEPVRVLGEDGVILDPPVGREQFRDLQPPIFVEEPAHGAPCCAGRLRGEAMVEDEFFVNLQDESGIDVSGFAVPISGAGWIQFDVDLAYFVEVDQVGSLLVFARTSDGLEDDIIGSREIPVQLLLSESAVCSADGLSPVPEPQDLPEPVAATRQAIIEAATACDFDALAELASDPFFTYSFGSAGDPKGFWQSAEARGGPITRHMVQLLNTPPALLIEDLPEPTYMWPTAFVVFPVSAADLEPLHGILEDDELDAYAQFGEYLGLRLGIAESGRWDFAVAGD